jgi:muconolactone delta-isomerase
MKILALEKPGRRSAEYIPEARLADEARRVWELEQEGSIREIYFRADRSEAVLMLECPDIAEAERTLGTLPLVRDCFIDFDIIPLKAYPGFERLFLE